MKIVTKVPQPEYIRLVLIFAYRNPLRILINLAGLYFITAGLYYASLPVKTTIPFQDINLGILLMLLTPYNAYVQGKKSYNSSLKLQEEIEYIFTDEKISLSGFSFHSEAKWNDIYKIVELKNWFLIYEGKNVANFISKKEMSPSEINELREILHSVTIAGEKKLRK